MRLSTKAALLSGLVFPGLGQMIMKRYRRGTLIFITVLMAIVTLAAMATSEVLTALEKMQTPGAEIDLTTALNLAAASSSSSGFYYNVILTIIVICWLFSIIDAYMIGKKIESGIPR
jgi:TM2 domain-containing membrane protein YozV